jgi:hypothetical protein
VVTWVYGVADRGWDLPEAPIWVLLVAVQILVGAVLRWWALLLPGAMLLLSIPAGYSDAYSGADIPIWFSVMVLGVMALPLIVVGVLGGYYVRRGPRLHRS